MLRNYTLFLFLLISASFANAQQSEPTFEETVRFLNNQAKRCIGSTSSVPDEIIIINVQFDGFKNIVSWKFNDNENFIITDTYTIDNWDLLSGVGVDVDKERCIECNCTTLGVSFKNPNIKKVQSWSVGPGPTEEFTDYMWFTISKDKLESVLSAFHRLRTIAEEQNKDPFAK